MTLCDDNPDEVAAFEGLMGIDCFMDSDCEEDGNAVCLAAEGAADDDLADTLSSFMARMQLRHSPSLGFPRDVFCSATHVILGRVHVMWGRTYKVTCKRHANCFAMLEERWIPDQDSLQRAIYHWLCLGKYVSAVEHEGAARRLAADAQKRGSSSKLASASYEA
jgi:hypothetical protein